MHAELLKLRALPTPRWTLAVCLGATAIALIISVFAGVGEEPIAVNVGAELPSAIGSIVLGAWIIGLEYGQRTMGRTLTADPRRARLLGAKLAVALLASAALTIVVLIPSIAVFPVIADSHDASFSAADMATILLAALPGNLVYCTVGAAIALLTRSMSGGMTAALVFAFVLDSALSAIPGVGDYMLQSATFDIYETIRNEGDDPDLARGILMSTVWIGVLMTLGASRLIRTDV